MFISDNIVWSGVQVVCDAILFESICLSVSFQYGNVNMACTSWRFIYTWMKLLEWKLTRGEMSQENYIREMVVKIDFRNRLFSRTVDPPAGRASWFLSGSIRTHLPTLKAVYASWATQHTA